MFFDFSEEEINSDGAVLLLEILDRKHKAIKCFSKFMSDSRNPFYITHSIEKLLKQRVYVLMLSYEDANDVIYLKNDPLLQDLLGGELTSQPIISRLENSLDKQSIFELC